MCDVSLPELLLTIFAALFSLAKCVCTVLHLFLSPTSLTHSFSIRKQAAGALCLMVIDSLLLLKCLTPVVQCAEGRQKIQGEEKNPLKSILFRSRL